MVLFVRVTMDSSCWPRGCPGINRWFTTWWWLWWCIHRDMPDVWKCSSRWSRILSFMYFRSINIRYADNGDEHFGWTKCLLTVRYQMLSSNKHMILSPTLSLSDYNVHSQMKQMFLQMIIFLLNTCENRWRGDRWQQICADHVWLGHGSYRQTIRRQWWSDRWITAGVLRFAEVWLKYAEFHILWSLSSVDFQTLTLQLPYSNFRFWWRLEGQAFVSSLCNFGKTSLPLELDYCINRVQRQDKISDVIRRETTVIVMSAKFFRCLRLVHKVSVSIGVFSEWNSIESTESIEFVDDCF